MSTAAPYALVFPGQGSQYVGMGRALAAEYAVVQRTFAEADERLDFPLSRLCFEGPEAELVLTANTQPAILAVSVATYRLFAEQAIGAPPAAVLGHSLGEYSALVAAGALDFGDALQTVRLRGQLMESAVPPGAGGMTAILGLDLARVEQICARASAHGVVAPATLNGPGQIVIAGASAALAVAAGLAQEAGARRVQPLNVSGPFHSPLLKGVGEALGRRLDGVEVRPAGVPVLANATADYVREPKAIKQALIEQVFSPVRWEESVRRALADGVRTFVELGPGRVLSGLIRRIDKEAVVTNVEDPESWEKALALLKGGGLI
ncbi:MAG TPA: ACP S-malonyltransferase [Limnochordia bacterium]|nr:ACP S-malonyltransferase [Limnochordia bacterium]